MTVDAAPYLSSFFDAVIAELYIDPFFRQQMSDVLRVRAAMSMQRSLTEIVTALHRIGETLVNHYTPEQFELDVQAYTEHIERALRYLKLVGVVPKDRGSDTNKDPELNGIFVPLRVAIEGPSASDIQKDSILDLFEYNSCIVLLGGPGWGKSIATRHLAWSHAVANLSNSTSHTNASLLPGKPLPLRIELRRLNEDRKQRPDYDFLSYASEVILGRTGLNISPQMFELLLERRIMLILFDGLDEVATVDERRVLVEEIESFAQRYPGNRFLVTSRPVGYDLASLSDQIFSQAQIQPFDDKQIHLFLEHWYTHVLRLSPLSPDDQEELEELFTNLKDNPRLHDLAENPLLLTVITALHRYERLPDKRILVYDRCADLLLETWAKLRGTNIRWQDLKLSKEDQYACVAHLGFVLHEQSQEQKNGNINEGENITSDEELASDVPSRFMLREIERFLQNQNLFSSMAEKNIQSKRFLDLVQEEAGLIVERGTDESGESLYGFVHRTFQEYFAAADVYERYQQEEDATIISRFLIEHLHDPHWREVILLLFGKLKRKPATAQLRQILTGNSKSLRSKYNDLLQQDLFFISSCLIEGIAVENDLAESIISELSRLVKNTPFPSQRAQALEALAALIRTQLYAVSALEDLRLLLTQTPSLDIAIRLDTAVIFFKSSPAESEERQLATQMLLQLAQRSDLSIEQAIQAAQSLYQFSPEESAEERLAIQILLDTAQNISLTTHLRLLATAEIFSMTYTRYLERIQAVQVVLDILQEEAISQQFEKHWEPIVDSIKPESSDVPYLIQFASNEILPTTVRDDIFQTLRDLVPQLSSVDIAAK